MGWKNQSLRPIEAVFNFDQPREISAIKLNVHKIDTDKDLGFISKVMLECSMSEERLIGNAFVFSELQAPKEEEEDLVLKPSNAKCLGEHVKLRIYFKGKWLAIGEVSFESGTYHFSLFS